MQLRISYLVDPQLREVYSNSGYIGRRGWFAQQTPLLRLRKTMHRFFGKFVKIDLNAKI